jgi:hypothetical protein
MRKVGAGLALIWLLVGVGIEVATYLPFDPEWALLATAGFFGTTFLVGAVGAFFMAPRLARIRSWPSQLPAWSKWVGVTWAIYAVVCFGLTFMLPGVPTHCGTLGSPVCGHTYVFNNHGFLTVTDRAGFLAGVRISVRSFASVPIALLSLILVAYHLMNQYEALPSPQMAGRP